MEVKIKELELKNLQTEAELKRAQLAAKTAAASPVATARTSHVKTQSAGTAAEATGIDDRLYVRFIFILFVRYFVGSRVFHVLFLQKEVLAKLNKAEKLMDALNFENEALRTEASTLRDQVRGHFP